ncbi:hypothetical protein I5730_14760 [Acinetobacter nosocomialis]|uniref:hypothetical protein n=1 Tax=Acinetobacter TaxID=469 RepID=UPI001900A2E3|nr:MULTISPECIES: hypothetical protein [Acinetobacter]MBJ9961802.1 hypothetical protein [Acinetobacter nosocomialis]MCO8114655.1 hypothetical protein [Acinetobacter lwoffii]
MSKFPRQLMSDMWDSNVRFDKILHIPTLSASMSDRISDEFQEFLSDAYEDYQNAALLEQCPALASTLKEIQDNDSIEEYSSDIARDLYKECGDFEFLVCLEMALPYNFSFNDKGQYLSNSLGGIYQGLWILAKDMTEAAQLAIQKAEALWEKECEKAKREIAGAKV